MKMSMDKYIVKDDVVYSFFTDPLFSGYVPTSPVVPKGVPWLGYIGPKITLELWTEVLAFFAYTYDLAKSESQVRLYLNKEEKRWRAWAFPQEYTMNSMVTKEMEEHEGPERVLAGLGKGWIQGGTIHHHCAMGAFQSGTDKGDETTKQGIHITVGKIDQAVHDLHGRVAFRQSFYKNPDWSEWFQMPPGLEGLPHALRSSTMEYFLTRAAPEKHPFPNEWKRNFIKKVWTSSAPTAWGGANHSASHAHPGYHGHAEDSEFDWERDGGNNASTTPKSPSKKQIKKHMKRLTQRNKAWTAEDRKILEQVAVKVAQLCTVYDIHVRHLFNIAWVAPQFLGDQSKNALEALEDILSEAKIDLEDIEDWINSVTLGIAEEKTVPAGKEEEKKNGGNNTQ